MSLWSKGIERSKTGNVRKEDDKTNMIDEFFANQTDVKSYEVTDDKNWTVNVDGSIHLYEDDLDSNGELFFKIDKLSENMYCHCRCFDRSVVPNEVGGKIVFVLNEDELAKIRRASAEEDNPLGMGYYTAKDRTASDLINNVRLAFADLISRAAAEGVDLEELWNEVLEQINNKDKYKLRIEFKKSNTGKTITNIYVSEDDKDKLELNPIQTTFYLMFAMSENGLIVDDLMKPDWLVAKQIYAQLANTEQKTYIEDKESREFLDYKDGILNKPFTPATIRGYLSEIRKKLEQIIYFEDVRQGFTIDGGRGKSFKIAQSTQEIRDKICEEFGFD